MGFNSGFKGLSMKVWQEYR